jgi:hypothetical protein
MGIKNPKSRIRIALFQLPLTDYRLTVSATTKAAPTITLLGFWKLRERKPW